MTHTYTTKGSRRYRYYVCSHATKHGFDQCSTRYLPAGEIERYVLDQIRGHLGDHGLPDEIRALDIAHWIQRIEYDGQLGDLNIHFDPTPGATVREQEG